MRKLYKLTGLLAAVALWASCGESLEDTYSDMAGDGKIRYLAKCSELTATAGWKRIYVEWKNGVDATVEGIKVKWSANDVERDTMLPPTDTTCTLENLVDGSYRIDVCSVNGDKESLMSTTYVRPYTETHEIVLAFTRGISKCYPVGDNLAFFTDVWSDNIEEVALHYIGTDDKEKTFPLTREVYEKQFNTVEGIDFEQPITITRLGRIEGCPDLIQFEPLELDMSRVFTSDFKNALERRYGITDKTPDEKVIFDQFVDTARVLEFDNDITTLEDVLYFPNLEKVVIGKNRYLDAEYNSNLPGRSALGEEERSEVVLAVANEWEGVTVERYADHYFETAPSFLVEMGIPSRKPLEELNYVLTTDVDTITNSVQEVYGYETPWRNLIDNDPKTVWLTNNTSSERTYVVTIKLKEPKIIKGVKFAQAQYVPEYWLVEDFFPLSAIVTVSSDEIEWTNLTYLNENLIGGGSGEVTLLPAAQPREVKFIRIQMTDRESYGSFRLRVGDIVPYY